jgi:hypothetical protein
MTFFLNLALLAILVGVAATGVALFWIARQDDSANGRIIGIGLVALVVLAALYIVLGRHWF